MGKGLAKSTKKQILNIAVLVVLVAVTLIILFTSNRELNFRSIADFLRRSNIWLLIAAFACMLGYILFEAVSLHLINRTLGHKSKFRSSVVYSTADVYYSAITPSSSGGQPASAFYMVRDGIPTGTATFSLVFNLIAYTGAIILLGCTAFVLQPHMFGKFATFAKVLIILGIVAQLLLLGFFIACMLWHSAVRKCGNGLITLLCKMHIIRKEEKWRGRLNGVIEKYAGSLAALKSHRALFVIVLLLNVLQRAVQMLIPCLVCTAVTREVPFWEIFAMQAFVTLGYNSVPLPGGVGAFEYLYLQIYSLRFETSFILAAMMVTRVISYYISMALSGVITLVYHGVHIRRKSDPPDDGQALHAGGEPDAQAVVSDTVAEADELRQPDAQDKEESLQTAEPLAKDSPPAAETDGEPNGEDPSDA